MRDPLRSNSATIRMQRPLGCGCSNRGEPLDKTLFLLRHAKSSWEQPALSDHDRPLAPRGRRAARVIAEHLRQQRIAPALVLCSSSARTRETLEWVASGFGSEAGVHVEIESGLYAASAEELLVRLREQRDDVSSVMLIGHNPAIQDLTLGLAGSGSLRDLVQEKFPTAALATLTVRGRWRDLGWGAAELVAFVKPRDLEADARGR
jgi:phosphohistidine phosphatase